MATVRPTGADIVASWNKPLSLLRGMLSSNIPRNLMKRKSVLQFGCLGVIILGCFLLASVLRDAYKMSWYDTTPSHIKLLAAFIDEYRSDHDHYPSKLTDLLENKEAHS